MRLLLGEGATFDLQSTEGVTPLEMIRQEEVSEEVIGALENCQMASAAEDQIAILIEQAGARESAKVLFEAISLGYIGSVRGFLKVSPDLIDATDSNGDGLLHVAVGRQDAEIVRCLLKLGATVDLRDQHGQSPLSKACTREDLEIAEMLIKANAS